VKDVVPRTSATVDLSPESARLATPYEDKIVPTLRHRQRADALSVSERSIKDDIERISSRMTNATSHDDLNPSEMIEANQILGVFDKALVCVEHDRVHFASDTFAHTGG
jgi:hypothetical protein